MTIIKNTFIIVLLLSASTSFSQEYHGDEQEIQKILKNIASFSQYYENGETDKIVACYTDKGKIMPSGAKIMEGKEDLTAYWTLSPGTKVLKHKVHPTEIRIVEDYAYDYGYYEGVTQLTDGSKSSWQGKYVIVWKKVGEDWKIEVDIWNRVNEPLEGE